jgi:hypothetical protein
MIVPAMLGSSYKGVTIIAKRKINISLLKVRLDNNSELITLRESINTKNRLIDSLLEKREDQINAYRLLLGYYESRNTYTIDNGKFMGAYQFGPSALNHLGLDYITLEKFRKNPNIFPDSLQDWAVVRFAEENQKMMSTKINLNYYIGRKINGVIVTRGGILAAAHLIGWSDCSKYLKTYGLFNPADGNGTTANTYMKHFKDHDIIALDSKDLIYEINKIWNNKKLTKYIVLGK